MVFKRYARALSLPFAIKSAMSCTHVVLDVSMAGIPSKNFVNPGENIIG
jgi:hypothetical protein